MKSYIVKKILSLLGRYVSKGSQEIILMVLMWMLNFLKEHIDKIEQLAKKTDNKVDDKIVAGIKTLILLDK